MSLAILLSMGLTACGGGGSSGNNSSNADDTAASLQLGLQVIDGYVEGAICFGDVNRNGSRDAAEAWKTTDASGKAVPPGISLTMSGLSARLPVLRPRIISTAPAPV